MLGTRGKHVDVETGVVVAAETENNGGVGNQKRHKRSNNAVMSDVPAVSGEAGKEGEVSATKDNSTATAGAGSRIGGLPEKMVGWKMLPSENNVRRKGSVREDGGNLKFQAWSSRNGRKLTLLSK